MDKILEGHAEALEIMANNLRLLAREPSQDAETDRAALWGRYQELADRLEKVEEIANNFENWVETQAGSTPSSEGEGLGLPCQEHNRIGCLECHMTPYSAAEGKTPSPPVMAPIDWIYWLNRIAPLEEAVARLEPLVAMWEIWLPTCKVMWDRLEGRAQEAASSPTGRCPTCGGSGYVSPGMEPTQGPTT
jgi:hypothetical protein